MIGRKAIDSVTGDLSPVIGVRRNPETKMAVPVTLATGGHRKQKAPPGALALLEEEIMARRGFWRRQRQKELDLTLKEHKLAHQLLYDMDSLTSHSLRKTLEEIDSDSQQLSDNYKREMQRRGIAQQDFSGVIPPEVVSIVTESDVLERDCEECHVMAHVKYTDTVRKFFSKLQEEEKRYQDRMADLDGAMNPEAEITALQRYNQAKSRLQMELRDQIATRMEALDQCHATLEYARQKSELCATESKVCLTRSALLAGDYDAQLSGAYGFGKTVDDGDSELVPLLRQLIAMLQSGGPFYLSPELLNLINVGGASSTNITNINVTGQQSAGGETGGQGQGQGEVKGSRTQGKTKVQQTQLVQSGTGDYRQTDPAPSVTVIGDPAKLQPTGSKTGDEMQKYLFEKQAYEAAQLENELKSGEIDNVNEILKEFDDKKRETVGEISEDTEIKLETAKTDEEKDKVVTEHAARMQKLDDAIEKQKQQQLAAMRRKLADLRRQRKKDLHRRHVQEAEARNVSPQLVPTQDSKKFEDMVRDLKRLQQEQELMNGEIRKTDVAKDDGMEEVDPDFGEKMKNLGLSKTQAEELVADAKVKQEELNSKSKSFLAKLQNRKGREILPKPSEEELRDLSEEERSKLLKAWETQNEADRMQEDQALFRAWKQNQKVNTHFIYCQSWFILFSKICEQLMQINAN